MVLGVVSEARTAGAVLGHNFPNSDWYKRAYALLDDGGVRPPLDGDSWLSRTLKLLPAGTKSDAPSVQPKAPARGHPTPEDMPAPKADVPPPAAPWSCRRQGSRTNTIGRPHKSLVVAISPLHDLAGNLKRAITGRWSEPVWGPVWAETDLMSGVVITLSIKNAGQCRRNWRSVGQLRRNVAWRRRPADASSP
jgi:hypothetical protein